MMESQVDFPSPLWGGIKGGGRVELNHFSHTNFLRPPDPHPGPPHKGEGGNFARTINA